MKKKFFAILLSTVLACGMLVGCNNTEEVISSEDSEVEVSESVEEPEVSEEEEFVEVIPENSYRSELTNEWIPEEIENQRPVAIMVDNEKTALDHYGLTQADIVYEMMNQYDAWDVFGVKDYDYPMDYAYLMRNTARMFSILEVPVFATMKED